jgi:hypothetical protein
MPVLSLSVEPRVFVTTTHKQQTTRTRGIDTVTEDYMRARNSQTLPSSAAEEFLAWHYIGDGNGKRRRGRTCSLSVATSNDELHQEKPNLIIFTNLAIIY